MNIDDLWIGDLVEILSTQLKGTFEGKNPDGRAKIKVGKDTWLAGANDLRIVDEGELAQPIDLELEDEDTIQKAKIKAFMILPDQLDLHIEKLNPEFEPNYNESTLQYQFKSFLQYFEQAIQERKSSITVIHGIGKGVLQKEILSYVKYHVKVFSYSDKNNGGAIEIIFNYR